MFVVDSASTTNLMPLHMAATVKKNSGRALWQDTDLVLHDYNQYDIQNHGTLVFILNPMVG